MISRISSTCTQKHSCCARFPLPHLALTAAHGVCVFVSLLQVWVYNLYGHDSSAATGAVSALVSLCLLCAHCRGVHGSHSATLASSAGDTWTDSRAAAGCGFDSLIRVGARGGVEELAACRSCGKVWQCNWHAQLADKWREAFTRHWLAVQTNPRGASRYHLCKRRPKVVGKLHFPMHDHVHVHSATTTRHVRTKVVWTHHTQLILHVKSHSFLLQRFTANQSHAPTPTSSLLCVIV